MTGDFSREAFAARLGASAFALAEADGNGAPDPGPELIERLRQILAPTVARLAERERVPAMADAA
jgi:hypothetical protein